MDQWLKQQEAGLEDTLGSLLGSLKGAAEAMHLEETERAERRRRLEQLIPVARRIEARLEAGNFSHSLAELRSKIYRRNVGAHLCVRPQGGHTGLPPSKIVH